MVKYRLSKREIPRAEPDGFPEEVIIQTFSISKSYISSIALAGRAILEELNLSVMVWQLGLYFPVLPSR